MPERTWNDAIDEIKSHLDIVDVISKYVILKKHGANYMGLCPFHNEKTPSFVVSPQKNIFKCFGCGKGGDSISFLMEMNKTSYSETIKELAQQFNIELPKSHTNFDKNIEKKTKALEALKFAQNFYTELLLNDKSAKVAYDYLKNRDISDEIIKKYGLGYSPNDYETLTSKMKDFGEDILETAGLIIKRENKTGYFDRFRDRLMVPIFDEKNNVVAFGSRTLKKDDDGPKYINSPDSIVYNKSKILYGFNFATEAIKTEDSVLIMEGYFDVITAQANGVKNAVATCGTALTPEHIKLISRYCASRKIYLAFDTDKAGQNATNRGADIIKEQLSTLGEIKQFGNLGAIEQYDEINTGLDEDKYSCEIRVVSPPEGKDPDEYIRANGGEQYKEHVKKAPLLIDYKLEQILKQKTPNMSPTEKLKIIKEICPILNEISNKIVKNEYIKIVATTLKLDEHSLQQELRKYASSQNYQIRQVQTNVTKNVTKSLNLSEKSQKNLLSLYLTKEGIQNKQLLSETIKNVEFSNKNLEILKESIDKISFSVNNIVDLSESLYTQFAEDSEKKEIITDLICLADTFKELKNADFMLALKENVANIEKFNRKQIKDELILQNKKDLKNEEEEIKYQKQLVDKLKKLRTGE